MNSANEIQKLINNSENETNFSQKIPEIDKENIGNLKKILVIIYFFEIKIIKIN